MRTCSNCEHREVCVVYTDKNEVCPKWQGWIKCEDELPSDFGDYLVAYTTLPEPALIRVCWFNNTDKVFFDEIAKPNDEIIAWRPIPEWEEEKC